MSFTRHLFRQNKGISLMEVLVIGALMSIVMFAMMSILHAQQVEVRSLQQKMEVVELKSLLLRSFSDASVCTWQFQNKVVNVTPGANFNPNAIPLTLPQLFQGRDASSPLLATQGEKLPISNYGLRVERISLGGFTSTGVADEYQGTLEVSFQPSSMARALKPVQIRQIFKTQPSDPPTAKRITACVPPNNGLACVTGSLTGLSGQKNIVNSVGYTPSSFDEVFLVKSGAANVNSWGVACQGGWALTGCVINSSGAVSSSGYAPKVTQDWDVRIDSEGFCKSDSEEYALDAKLTVICCRSGP